MNDHSKIVEAQKKIYGDRFDEFGDSPKGVYWNNVETQGLRFDRLLSQIRAVQAPNASIDVHEIGCGTGALCEFIKNQGLPWGYSGTEIVESTLHTAQEKFPDCKFYGRNILTENLPDAYDFVVASGVFNYCDTVDALNWRKYVEKMIQKMFGMARCGVAFNLLTSNITVPPDPTLFYMDPQDVIQFCQQQLSRFHILDQGYALYEYTVTVFKSEFIEQRYRSDIYGKYFGA